MSRMGGHALTSTAAAASLDRNNLQMSCVVIKQAERLTCESENTPFRKERAAAHYATRRHWPGCLPQSRRRPPEA